MHSFFRRSAVFLLLLCLFCSAFVLPSHAADIPESDTSEPDRSNAVQSELPTLSSLMERFMQDNGLDEENFSLSYYNTVTGESYSFAGSKLMLAASTYKLPLNMYYYDLEREGLLSPDEWIAGRPLSDCHMHSILYSDNDVSEAMIYHYSGTFHAYKDAMLSIFGMEDYVPEEEFYTKNVYSTDMMLAALKRLYDHADDYAQLLEYLKEAHPQDQYFRRYIADCEVAHKYGSFMGAENDVGIIYAEQPFLLAVYTYYAGPSGGEMVCAEAAQLLKDYTDACAQEAERLAAEEAAKQEAERLAAEEASQQEAERLASEEAAQTAASSELPPEQATSDTQIVWTDYLLVAAGAILVAGLGSLLIRSILHGSGKYLHRIQQKYDTYTDHDSEK